MNQGGFATGSPPPPASKTLFITTTFVRPTEITPKSVAHRRCRAAPDTTPTLRQFSGSVISSVQPPYQLLASGSPSSKLQGGVVHFRGSQRPCFPVEGKHEWISVGFWPEPTRHVRRQRRSLREYKCRDKAGKFPFRLFPQCSLHQSHASLILGAGLTWLTANSEQWGGKQT